MTIGRRFLIVDDDVVDQAYLARLLAAIGAPADGIKRASDGASGLSALQSHQFDCVLLDVSLPDMSGLDFLTNVVVDDDRKFAIVVVTGQGNEAVAVEAMKRGAHDYIVKGQLNEPTLRQSLTNAINLAGLQRRLASSLRDLTTSNLALKQEAAIREAAESDLRAAKEAAEQANQAKTRFVAMVTHELRTPLNGILGYAQLLTLEGGLSARQQTHVAAMTDAGRHLLEMIERVLDFASIESAEMKLHPVRTSVRETTDGCVAFISPLAASRGLTLRVEHATDAPSEIVADPARLRQVMLNLLGNAVKYTDTRHFRSLPLAFVPGFRTAGGLRVR
jgi:signal transduction histidine kinase